MTSSTAQSLTKMPFDLDLDTGLTVMGTLTLLVASPKATTNVTKDLNTLSPKQLEVVD